MSGQCQAGLAHLPATDANYARCHHLMQAARTVVKNGSGGSRIIEIPEMICSCACHREEGTK